MSGVGYNDGKKDSLVDDCLWREKSDHLRAELAELAETDEDYNSSSDSEQSKPSTSSESEDDAPLQSVTKLPYLNPEKSPLDVCEATKLGQFCSETCHCKLAPNGTPCSSTFSQDHLNSYRTNCLELLSNQLDLVILGHKGRRVCIKVRVFHITAMKIFAVIIFVMV